MGLACLYPSRVELGLSVATGAGKRHHRGWKEAKQMLWGFFCKTNNNQKCSSADLFHVQTPQALPATLPGKSCSERNVMSKLAGSF